MSNFSLVMTDAAPGAGRVAMAAIHQQPVMVPGDHTLGGAALGGSALGCHQPTLSPHILQPPQTWCHSPHMVGLLR